MHAFEALSFFRLRRQRIGEVASAVSDDGLFKDSAMVRQACDIVAAGELGSRDSKAESISVMCRQAAGHFALRRGTETQDG